MNKIDLAAYLPPFMSEYKELVTELDIAGKELQDIRTAADGILQNEYIETADTDGLSRFEKILNILPAAADTLESRRSRVSSRWFDTTVYTFHALWLKLKNLCGDNNFTLAENKDNYTVEIAVDLEQYGQVDELNKIIDSMIPCNMVVVSENEIPCKASRAAFNSGISFVEMICITDEETTQ